MPTVVRVVLRPPYTLYANCRIVLATAAVQWHMRRKGFIKAW